MLPLALAFIMFGMGLSLTRDDFKRLFKTPRAIILGLSGQLLFMPLLALAIAILFNLSAPLAIGLMILAACPGGTMSNVISHVARANLALSVTLTAFTTVICVFSTPWLIQLSINYFEPSYLQSFSLWQTTVGLIFITLLPVAAGIYLREKYPSASMRKEPFFRRFSAIFMVIMIIAILIQERKTLMDAFSDMFVATILLNVLSILVGAALGRLGRLNKRDSITLGIEVGIQNASMAILIAISFLKDQELAVSAGVYGITMFIGAFGLIWGAKLVSRPESSADSKT